jgi:spermidine synthase
VTLADVAEAIGQARASYDAILLDVDNGPDGLVRADNGRLYTAKGLAAAKDAPFANRLRKAGYTVDEATVRARSNGKGARHTIWFARAR